ncbi:hypothetical protein MTBLM1_80127 [Rhodospirillaceae bacterium LM-1]|nr:hypothetical protein MTBLM1_80127 [Rhodospirillaceae bacterium LM-1]
MRTSYRVFPFSLPDNNLAALGRERPAQGSAEVPSHGTSQKMARKGWDGTNRAGNVEQDPFINHPFD